MATLKGSSEVMQVTSLARSKVPTQRYDWKEIQKRLDLETWMDDQLKELYDGDEVSSYYF